MIVPSTTPVPAGQALVTLVEITMLVHDHGSASAATVMLPAGSIIQAWEPKEEWRGERVPVTLGDGQSGPGHETSMSAERFIPWDDFFRGCAPVDGRHRGRPLVERVEFPEYPRPADFRPAALDPSLPFAEIASLRQPLRDRGRQSMAADVMTDELLAIAASIEHAYDRAAEMQLGAEGFDNMTTAGEFSGVRRHLAAAAEDILAACRALLMQRR
jgi:hypothetical protein